MNIKNIKQFWSRKKKDFARLYRSMGDVERFHFDPKRLYLNDLEVQIIKLKKQITAKNKLFQKESQQDASSYILSKFRSPEKRLVSLRKSITKITAEFEQKQKEYTTQLNHYNDMVQAVSQRLRHKPSPEFSPVLAKQKTISLITRDRRSPENGLEL